MAAEAPVEFLWWEGCPSHERARAILAEELAAAGLGPELIAEREVADEATAVALGFPGSPTIRIAGRDIQDPGAQPYGLHCRAYRLRDGRISPLPDRADLREALSRIEEEETG